MEIEDSLEPIAHLEWTLGIGLIILAIWNTSVDALGLLLLGIGSVFPDIFDWALFHGRRFIWGHREISHTIFFLGFLIILSQIMPFLLFLTLGTVLHIIEDIISGGSPISLFSPLTHQGSIMLISKEQTIGIGGRFRKVIKGAYIGSENIGDELSWFWLQILLGSWILMFGILLYFSVF